MKRFLLHLLIVASIGVTAVSCTTYRPPTIDPNAGIVTGKTDFPSGQTRQDIIHDGIKRYYLMYVPTSVHLSDRVPLVMVFHGGGGMPENIAQVSGFNQLADQHGFVVIYPSGTGNGPNRLFWNVLLSGTYATQQNIDDLAFVKSVLENVESRIAVNSSRIYATGFSQGGMLCYRLACDSELSARIAAIAPVGATMTVKADACAAVRPVPVISIHGIKDPYNNYHGGISARAPRNDRVSRPGVEESVQYWVTRGGLPKEPDAIGSRGMADMRQHGPGTNDYEVVSWSIREGGHTWPGSSENLPEWLVGKVNRDIDASMLIWDFFSRHRLP